MDRSIVLDFETYFDPDYNLRKLSYPEYIHDDRFHAFGLAWDENGKQGWVDGKDVPRFLKKTVGKKPVIVHNGYFDAAILAWKYDFRPARIIDNLSLANHVYGSSRDGSGGKNDVATLAEKLGLEAKGRLDFMKGVRYPDEAQIAALAAYAMGDVRIERGIYEKLLPLITRRDFELWLAEHTLRIYTDKPLPVDVAKVKAVRKLVEDRRRERVLAAGVDNTVLSSNKQFAEELTRRLKAAKVALPMKRGKNGMIPALAKTDTGFLSLAEHANPAISNLVRGRLVERSATQALARLKTLENYNAIGGIRTHLVYYGAHTGRFAAGGGFNLQNLTDPAKAVDPVDKEIAAGIRASILPGKGLVFVRADAAQIEARVLAWLAGEQSILDDFASGTDLYSKFISGVLGEDIHKPRGDETPVVKQHLTLMRNVGKTAVLGLGYSMGVDKFLLQLKQKGITSIAPKLAAKIVYGYREMYPNVVEFWKEITDAFTMAIRGAVRKVGVLEMRRLSPGVVGLTLPSTRMLYYRDIRAERRTGTTTFIDANGRQQTIERDGREYKHGNGQRIYGGLLAENVTQAVSRDILAESIQRSEDRGYPVVLHVHDEIVCRVPKVQGPAALKFLEQALSTPPEWGKGLVLGAEGAVTESLSK